MPDKIPNMDLDLSEPDPRSVALGPGAMLLGGFARPQACQLLEALTGIIEVAPLRHMVTPGGRPMSVAMTNCGNAGWVSDRTGYRYDPVDPDSGELWPAMPDLFGRLAVQAAAALGFPGFRPDACLINRYEPGTRLTLHQDRNERDFYQPIVSVSLGLPAIFLWGGQRRSDRPRRVSLFHGDVVVWGGPARMTYHGVHEIADGNHPLTGATRYNLTFRKAL